MSVTDVARVMRPEGWMHAAAEPRYTIATLVSDRAQYDAMRASFRPGGFADGDCEYLFIDNTGARQIDAYRGLNALLNAARAPIVILCHQDVRLLSDGRDALDARLPILDLLRRIEISLLHEARFLKPPFLLPKAAIPSMEAEVAHGRSQLRGRSRGTDVLGKIRIYVAHLVIHQHAQRFRVVPTGMTELRYKGKPAEGAP